jgi:hypothetical protein
MKAEKEAATAKQQELEAARAARVKEAETALSAKQRVDSALANMKAEKEAAIAEKQQLEAALAAEQKEKKAALVSTGCLKIITDPVGTEFPCAPSSGVHCACAGTERAFPQEIITRHVLSRQTGSHTAIPVCIGNLCSSGIILLCI